MAAALDAGAVTAGHVDAITRAGKTLDPVQREQLLDRVDALVDVAEHAGQAEFARRVRDEARRLQVADGMDTLERQRRATTLRSWVDLVRNDGRTDLDNLLPVCVRRPPSEPPERWAAL